MFCPKCGEKNLDGAKFCAACGASFGDRAAPLQPQDAPVGRPRKRRMPVAVVVVLTCALLGVGAVVAMNVLSGMRAQQERDASNASLANQGGGAEEDDLVFFYSTKAGGICRARAEDSSSVEVIYPVDKETHWVTSLVVEGDTLFFVLADYVHGGAPEVHSIKTDGSSDQLLFTGSGNDDPGAWGSIDQLRVVDGTLYAIWSRSGAREERYFDLYGMSLDGTDQRLLAHVDGVAGSGVILANDRLYYVDNQFDSVDGTTQASIMSLSLGGDDLRTVHRSVGCNVMELVVSGGRLYFQEYGGITPNRVVSVGLDGSDPLIAYELSPSLSGLRIRAAAQDGVYVEVYGLEEKMPEPTSWDLLLVRPDGSDPAGIANDLTIYNPTITNTGSRLLVLENGQYQGSVGERVMSLSLDGASVLEYQLG